MVAEVVNEAWLDKLTAEALDTDAVVETELSLNAVRLIVSMVVALAVRLNADSSAASKSLTTPVTSVRSQANNDAEKKP